MEPGAASAAPTALDRCAVHPARRAVDLCPRCGRLRCGADVSAYAGSGCAACTPVGRAVPAARGRELAVRAALAGLAAAYVGGWIAAQYVDTRYFSLIAPALAGLVGAGAVGAATRALPQRVVLAAGAVAGVVATALSYRLVPGGQNLFLPPSHRLPPYLAAAVGALLWPALFGPPRPTAGQPRGIRRK